MERATQRMTKTVDETTHIHTEECEHEKNQTLAQYIYMRMSDEQVKFQRDRPKRWPSGLFITSVDIDRYIREYVLSKRGTVSDTPFEEI
jgi:hypothetical protein